MYFFQLVDGIDGLKIMISSTIQRTCSNIHGESFWVGGLELASCYGLKLELVGLGNPSIFYGDSSMRGELKMSEIRGFTRKATIWPSPGNVHIHHIIIIYIHIYIYIYISNLHIIYCVYIYIYTYIHTYQYVYIYIYIDNIYYINM